MSQPTPMYRRYEIAHAAATDAGNRSMRAAGRRAWTLEALEAALTALEAAPPPAPHTHAQEPAMPHPTPCRCYSCDDCSSHARGTVHIVYCPLHAQAPALRAALQALVTELSKAEDLTVGEAQAWTQARALLHEIKRP
jgi:hypothetical protein